VWFKPSVTTIYETEPRLVLQELGDISNQDREYPRTKTRNIEVKFRKSKSMWQNGLLNYLWKALRWTSIYQENKPTGYTTLPLFTTHTPSFGQIGHHQVIRFSMPSMYYFTYLNTNPHVLLMRIKHPMVIYCP